MTSLLLLYMLRDETSTWTFFHTLSKVINMQMPGNTEINEGNISYQNLPYPLIQNMQICLRMLRKRYMKEIWLRFGIPARPSLNMRFIPL